MRLWGREKHQCELWAPSTSLPLLFLLLQEKIMARYGVVVCTSSPAALQLAWLTLVHVLTSPDSFSPVASWSPLLGISKSREDLKHVAEGGHCRHLARDAEPGHVF